MAEGGVSRLPRKWLAILLVLAVVSPIGILIVWNYGDAWGEWGEVGTWVPQQFWNAPLPDYDLSGWESQAAASLGYIISAIIGIAAVILLTYGLSLLVARRHPEKTTK